MDLMVLNEKFDSIDVIDEYESLIWTDRYSKCGDFEIYTFATTDIINKLAQKRFLYNPDSEHIMVIENIEITTDVEKGNKIKVTGRSAESLLDRRIIWEQITLDGYLQGQIKKLLEKNAISPDIEERKIPHLIFEETDDPAITELTISKQYTGDNLYDVIADICDTYKIGFKIRLTNENKLAFSLYAGADRSYDQFGNPHIVFSPNFENLVNTNFYKSNTEIKTLALVAGEDEGLGINRRKLVVGNEDLIGFDRRELFVDARDIQSEVYGEDGETTEMPIEEYEKLLKERGEEKLAEYKNIHTFEGEVEPTVNYTYGMDYFIGDICQIENEFDMQAKARITEFIFSESTSGINYYPTFEIIEELEEETVNDIYILDHRREPIRSRYGILLGISPDQ